QVEILRRVAEQPEQQRDLSPVMSPVIGRVLQQLSYRHGALLSVENREFDDSTEVVVAQFRKKLARMRLDPIAGINERRRCRVVLGIERRATLQPSASPDPTQFSAQNVNQRLADGAMIPRQRFRELVRSELGDQGKELSVRPVAVVEKALQVVDGHTVLE